MSRIAVIIGSLREDSLNRQLAEQIAVELGQHADVTFLAYADLPLMNPDLEWPVPNAVERVRKEVGQADGLWFVCPEYNGSYPGHVKNLIDWLGRPIDPSAETPTTAIHGKKTTVSGVGDWRGTKGMQGQLVSLLEHVGAEVMVEPTTALVRTSDALRTDMLMLSADELAAIANQAAMFYAYVSDSGGEEDVPRAAGVPANGSVPGEPSEGGVFATGVEIGSCSEAGCTVH